MSVKDFLEKDYYAALGVPKSADADAIKKAYRKLAVKYHPDKNKGDAEAEERFKEISEAHAVLSDPARRAEYDEVRAAGVRGGFRGAPGGGAQGFDLGDLFGRQGPSGPSFDDVFGDIFGGRGRRRGPARGDDLETSTSISFEDALHGATVQLSVTTEARCSSCAGSGAQPGTSISQCATCHGMGQVQRNQGGFAFAEPCPSCRGSGRIVATPCTRCRGRGIAPHTRTINARLPEGVRDGQRIRLKGKGGAGEPGAPDGDLFVTVRVTSHALFGRAGRNLTITVPIGFDEAALGARVTVPTPLGDPVTLKIPAGTSSGQTFRVKGAGVRSAKADQGDLLVTVEVAVPQRLTDQMREAVEAYRDATAELDVRADLRSEEKP
ncbi:MAG TPA: molecular chaperone DnaJ [Actinobacteria bacterium]|nr:molecular chaperone DnaJ [Actinomycetota bacterium]HCK78663.1 molecular chaperone DnaJ [Actinomycetota bacterium]